MRAPWFNRHQGKFMARNRNASSGLPSNLEIVPSRFSSLCHSPEQLLHASLSSSKLQHLILHLYSQPLTSVPTSLREGNQLEDSVYTVQPQLLIYLLLARLSALGTAVPGYDLGLLPLKATLWTWALAPIPSHLFLAYAVNSAPPTHPTSAPSTVSFPSVYPMFSFLPFLEHTPFQLAPPPPPPIETVWKSHLHSRPPFSLF